MKKAFLFLVGVLFLNPLKAESGEEFLTNYRGAIEQKDKAKLLSLYYTNGCSESDTKMLDAIVGFHFSDGKITEVRFEPTPAGTTLVNIANGKKYEPTYPPVGQVKITYAPVAGNGMISGGDGYAIINGKYYLITAKSTDLGWSGPKDKTLTFMVMGAGMEKVKVQAKWNVSGVDQEKVFSNPPSCNFPGQYFESITATSTEDDTDVTLSILEDGKQIYESKPLKGKGTIEYKRGQ
jgi:hypothetical protein